MTFMRRLYFTIFFINFFSSYFVHAKSFLKVKIDTHIIQIPFDHNFALTSDDIFKKIVNKYPHFIKLERDFSIYIAGHKRQKRPMLSHFSLKDHYFKYNRKAVFHLVLSINKEDIKNHRLRKERQKKLDIQRKKEWKQKYRFLDYYRQ